MRSSRILEAALRGAQRQNLTSQNPTYTMQLLLGAFHTAMLTTSPEGAFGPIDLLQNKRLVVRCGSQQVSALKAICQPLASQVDPAEVVLLQIQVASGVAMLGPTVHSWPMSHGR